MKFFRRLFGALSLLIVLLALYILFVPTRVLMLGVDSGGLERTEQGRTDVMLAMKTRALGATQMVSIPRDTYTEIPGYGMDKINHAYAYEGPALTQETTEELLGLSLKGYVVVDMTGLIELVDLVGGIAVTSPDTFVQDDYYFEAGQTAHLDGRGTLAYVRNRDDSGGDYGRQARQRDVIQAIFRKVASASALSNFSQVAQTLNQYVDTNVDIINLGKLAIQYRLGIGGANIVQLEGEETDIDGVYYNIPLESSLEEVREILR